MLYAIIATDVANSWKNARPLVPRTWSACKNSRTKAA